MTMTSAVNLVWLAKNIHLKLVTPLKVPFKTTLTSEDSEPEPTPITGGQAGCHQRPGDIMFISCCHEDGIFKWFRRPTDMKISPQVSQFHSRDKLSQMSGMCANITYTAGAS